jgi:hypothetical protein
MWTEIRVLHDTAQRCLYGASIRNNTFSPQPAQIMENVDSIRYVTLAFLFYLSFGVLYYCCGSFDSKPCNQELYLDSIQTIRRLLFDISFLLFPFLVFKIVGSFSSILVIIIIKTTSYI